MVKVLTSGLYEPYREEWLDSLREEIIEPDLPIVDAHHHIWDAPRPRYMADELLRDVRSGHRITATVYVDCRSMYRKAGPAEMRCVGEVEFANGVAAIAASGEYGESLLCDGIVGFGSLHLGDAALPVLQASMRAGGHRFKGVRHISSWDSDPLVQPMNPARPPRLLSDPAFRRGFGLLAGLGLTFDAFVFQTQIAELIDLAQAYPDTSIVLDHLGGPLGVGSYAGRHDEMFAAWKARMLELSRCPNVSVKLGGLGMVTAGFGFDKQDSPPSSMQLAQAWRPHVETCIEAFGTRRCMFESNFPPDKASCSYPVLWNALKRIAEGASANEKADLFSGTATRFYRLGDPPTP